MLMCVVCRGWWGWHLCTEGYGRLRCGWGGGGWPLGWRWCCSGVDVDGEASEPGGWVLGCAWSWLCPFRLGPLLSSPSPVAATPVCGPPLWSGHVVLGCGLFPATGPEGDAVVVVEGCEPLSYGAVAGAYVVAPAVSCTLVAGGRVGYDEVGVGGSYLADGLGAGAAGGSGSDDDSSGVRDHGELV